MTLRERISDQPSAQIEALQQRIQSLYQQGAVHAQSDMLLSQAFEELAHALDALQAARQILHQQREEWLNQQTAQQLECQRYRDLFMHAPAAYLVTSIDGAIRQANSAALVLFETSTRAIVGRSLAAFVSEEQQKEFRAQIPKVLQSFAPQEWTLSMCSWHGSPLAARLTASVLRGPSRRPLALYWLIRALDEPSAGKESLNF